VSDETDPRTLLEQAEAVAARVFAGETVPVAQRDFALAVLRRVPVKRSNPEEARGEVGEGAPHALRLVVEPMTPAQEAHLLKHGRLAEDTQ
jgi:hypothetical protein